MPLSILFFSAENFEKGYSIKRAQAAPSSIVALTRNFAPNQIIDWMLVVEYG